MMDLSKNWDLVKTTFEAGIKSSLHCAIASVGPDGCPHVTPIGFVFLRDDFSAFYFEEYTQKMRRNIEHNPRVCLLVVNSSRWLWLASLFKGRFTAPPGLRLVGLAGERRPAREEEKALYRARVRPFRRLKGYDLIWKDLNFVREIRLESFEPVVYPKMTDQLFR
jgi:hypothetical protein